MKLRPQSLSRSDLKNWLRKNGFRPHGYRQVWRHCWRFGVFRKGNHLYRFRDCGRLVDISHPLETFDRWANSCKYRSLPQQLFLTKNYVEFV